MAVAKMKKVHIVAHLSRKTELVAALQEWAVLQVAVAEQKERHHHVQAGASAVSASEAEALQAEIGRALVYLKRFDSYKEGLIDSFMGLKAGVSPELDAQIRASFDARAVAQATREYDKRLTEIASERRQLQAEQSALLAWSSLKVRLKAELSGTVNMVFGTVLQKDMPAFLARLDVECAGLYHVEQVQSAGNKLNLAIVYHRSVSPAVIKEAIFTPAAISTGEETPAEALLDVQTKLQALLAEAAAIAAASVRLVDEKLKLQVMYDYYGSLMQRERAQAATQDTRQTFWLEGWTDVDSEARLTAELAERFPDVYVRFEDPAPNEVPPVKLKNHKLAKPFELVTNMYGWPMYSEIDPTLALAPFFGFFFALALGDAGYGLIILAACWWFVKKYKLDLGSSKFFSLFVLAGLLAVPIGFAVNGFFGDLLDYVPVQVIQDIRQSLVLIDPITNPMGLMAFSVALGVIHILLGIGLRAYMKWRSGDKAGAVLDQGPWLFLLLSLVMLALTSVLPGLGGMVGLAQSASLLGAVIVVATQGRGAKGILGKLGLGLYSLYGGVGYFSDALSYTRLMALGMSTAVIAMVINTIAMMLVPIPVVGWLGALLLLVVGHLFNLLLSGLGCFVHSARLQFVEFFTKFFEGGGVPFKPFQRESKFTVIRG
jgi:V/A-type H+-transporting ATPase subunit I